MGNKNYKTPQGQNSPTWCLPPLDESLNLWQLYEFHRVHSPNHPLFVYRTPLSDNESGELKTIGWGRAGNAVRRAAKIVRNLVEPLQEGSEDEEGKGGKKVIAILTNRDTITYSTLIFGIIRAGYIPFPISPRNSPPMIAHLLSRTKPFGVFVGTSKEEQGILFVLRAALALLSGEDEDSGFRVPRILDTPYFESFYPLGKEDEEVVEIGFEVDTGMDDLAAYMHSSGSTAFPKPIPITHRFLHQQGMLPWFGDVDFCGMRCSLTSLPMFHSAGNVPFTWALEAGLTLTVLPPVYPPPFPTPNVAFEGMQSTSSALVYGISVHLEEWTKDKSKIEYMKSMKAVIYQGAPLTRRTGKNLISNGVPLVPMYGMTEGGAMSYLIPDEHAERDFEYFRFSPHYSMRFIEQVPGQPEVYELILVKTPTHTPAIINTVIDGQEGYATSDLLVPHPDPEKNKNKKGNGLWKIFGRKDFQVTLSLGEKVNPGPIESALAKDPNIRSVVMFGRARPHVGILVDPVQPFDPRDEEELARFRNRIWGTVEDVNGVVPAFARISKEMIIVLDPTKPFSYSIKGEPRRHLALEAYEKVIDEAYKAAYESAQRDIPAPETWDEEGTRAFLRVVVGRVLGKGKGGKEGGIEDDRDFYAVGCDSLQSTWIKNSVLHALRKTHPDLAREIPQDVVYQNPNINLLARFIVRCVSGEGKPNEVDARKTEFLMRGLRDEVVAGIITTTSDTSGTKSRDSEEEQAGDVVLLTGTTGALGSNILASLLQDPDVKLVYAANRPSKEKELSRRQEEAFRERGVDVGLLESEKLRLVEMDTSEGLLGVSAELYEEIQQSVTHVIHNAWPVEFKYTILSFKESLHGLKNLVNFCLSVNGRPKPRFVYVSSVAAFRNYIGDVPVPEEHIEDFNLAVGFGYGESKLVSESVLEYVAESTGLNVVCVRVGQLSGGLNGAWSTREWLPALVQSGLDAECLPRFTEAIAWLPVHTAAKCLIEMRNSPHRYLHLIHPRPTEWTTIFNEISKELGVPLVEPDEWIRRVEGSESENARSSALELLKSYRGRGGDRESPKMAIGRALEVSGTLGDEGLGRVGRDDVMGWLEYWRLKGFI